MKKTLFTLIFLQNFCAYSMEDTKDVMVYNIIVQTVEKYYQDNTFAELLANVKKARKLSMTLNTIIVDNAAFNKTLGKCNIETKVNNETKDIAELNVDVSPFYTLFSDYFNNNLTFVQRNPKKCFFAAAGLALTSGIIIGSYKDQIGSSLFGLLAAPK